jgi:hypothetical protein
MLSPGRRWQIPSTFKKEKPNRNLWNQAFLSRYDRAAYGKLPKMSWITIKVGLDEITLRENTVGWERLETLYKFGESAPRMSTTVPANVSIDPRCADRISQTGLRARRDRHG